MKYKYCYLCGSETKEVNNGHEHYWQCTNCSQQFFPNPKPAAEAIVVTSDKKIVVAIRGREPHKGKYDLPGGFVDKGEGFERALKRELNEELGITDKQYSGPFYISSYAHNDYQWGREIFEVVNSQYTVRLKKGVIPKPADDIESIKILALDKIPKNKFAWPGQYPAILSAYKYWTNKPKN